MTPEQRERAIGIVTQVLGNPLVSVWAPTGNVSHTWYGKGRARPVRVDISEDLPFVGIWSWPNYPLEWQRDAYLIAKELTVAGIPRVIHKGNGEKFTIEKVEDYDGHQG